MSEIIMDYLKIFFCSMLPLVELRGSIILGWGLGLPWGINYIISVIGNLIPVPFIIFFIAKILEWMKNVDAFKKIALFIEKKAVKNTAKVLKYATFGLFLFVAIPVPGTGAWTGALVAALVGMNKKYAFASITAGVLAAGFIMSGACYGFLGFLDFLA